MREVVLTRPGSEPLSLDGFRVAERDTPEPGPGEALVRIHHVSLDPYQWLRMRALDAGASPPGGAVGQVVASRSDDVGVGDWVTGELVWADHAVAPATALTRIEPHPDLPLHHYVGLLGLSGVTAYFGMTKVVRPEPDQTVVVTGAFGGVGQVAMRIARILGARVLGTVGSADKRAALEAAGLSAVDYHADDWLERVDAWAPDGVQRLFDNVWGPTAARIVERMVPLGRIALCGQISGLHAGRVAALDIDWYLILTRSLTLQGFRAVDHLAEYPAARAQLAAWYLSGELRQEVALVPGLDGAGAAFVDLIHGRRHGKTTLSTGVA